MTSLNMASPQVTSSSRSSSVAAMAAAATPAAASDSAAPPALLGDDAKMTEEEADDMLEDQCLHPIVIPHDTARAEIEAAMAEDVPGNVVDPASAQAIVPPAPKQYLKVIDLTLPTDGTAPNFIDLTNSGRNPCRFSEAFFTPKKDNNKKYAGHVTKTGMRVITQTNSHGERIFTENMPDGTLETFTFDYAAKTKLMPQSGPTVAAPLKRGKGIPEAWADVLDLEKLEEYGMNVERIRDPRCSSCSCSCVSNSSPCLRVLFGSGE